LGFFLILTHHVYFVDSIVSYEVILSKTNGSGILKYLPNYEMTEE